MKNLSKVLAILVVFTMVLSSVAFSVAGFTDVTDDASYAEAVNVGVALNLFKGYDDGTFKPDGDITRAEFAAIVVRMIGQEAQADGAKGATSFVDVPADHWAAGYINIVTRLGIVNGYGDGNFGPDDKVLYEQAIKMIVVALGYAPTIGSAGYPVGYLTKAGEIGLTSGVKGGQNGVAAPRGTVAQLAINGIDIPLMTQSGYGTNIDFIINDGYNDTTRKTLMSDNLGVVKLQVNVVDSNLISSSSKNDKTVKVNILNSYKTKYYEEFGNGSSYYAYPENYPIDTGATELATLVGAKCKVYVYYDENSSDDPVALYAAKDLTKSDSIVINSEDIEAAITAGDEISDTKVAEYSSIEYWESETDKKTTTVTVQPKAKIYYNGAPLDNVRFSDVVTAYNLYGSVELVKNYTETAADYDTVFVTDYRNIVVDTVNKYSKKVMPKNNVKALTFDPDDTTISATLYDANGATMNWEDLKEWDVISYTTTDYNNTKGSKTVVKAYLTGKSITGKITAIEDGDTTEAKYTIGDASYEYDTNSLKVSELQLSDEGTFYLDSRGRICYYDVNSTTNSNFAFIIDLDISGSIDSRTEIKLFNAKGEVLTYKTASKVKIDDISGIVSEDINKYKNDASMAITAVTGTAAGRLITNHGSAVYPDSTSTSVSKLLPVKKGQFITFNTNSSNEISQIDRPNPEAKPADAKGKFTQFGELTASSEYTESNNSLTTATGKVYLTDKTVIMIAPADASDDEDYELYNIASIGDEQIFENAYFFNVDEDKNVGAVLVTKDVTINDAGTGIAAVKSVADSTNAAGDSIYRVGSLLNGDVTSLDSVEVSSLKGSAPSVGDTVLPIKNSKGEIKEFRTIFSAAAREINATNVSQYNTPTTGKTKFYYGDVAEIRGYNVELVDEITVGGISTKDFTVPASANVYLYDERVNSSSNKVSLSDISAITARIGTSADGADKDKTIYEDGGDTINQFYIVAREYDGRIVDVTMYVYKTILVEE